MDGCDRRHRRPPALAGALCRVDDLGFEALWTILADFGRCLRFVDTDGLEQGDWGDLLAGNEVTAMARLGSLDLDREAAAFLEGLQARDLAGGLARLRALRHRLDEALAGLPDASLALLGGGVDQLVPVHLQEPLGRLVARPSPGVGDPPAADVDRTELRSAFFALLGAARRLQAAARAGLPRAIAGGRQPPAIGLLLAFVRVYAQVQAEMNGFARRHCDWYYDDHLRLGPRQAHAGGLYLLPTRAAGAPEVTLRAGTRFLATAARQRGTVGYETVRDVVLSDASVKRLATLRSERHPLISPECAFGWVTGVSSCEFPASGDGTVRSLFGGATGDLPDAGADARLGFAWASPVLWLQEGDRALGLTIHLVAATDGPHTPAADPAGTLIDRLAAADTPQAFRSAAGDLLGHWLLDTRAANAGEAAGGPFDEDDIARLRAVVGASALLGRLAAWGWRSTQDLASSDPLHLFLGRSPPQRELVLETVLSGLFSLSLSTATGWLSARSPLVRRGAPDARGHRGLAIDWRLTPEDPPIEPCRPAVHGPGWSTDVPTLRVLVGDSPRLHPVSVLRAVRMRGLSLSVAVRQVGRLRLHNQLGQLDASKPFAPFGPLPDAASYLIVGVPEAARKPIDRIVLHLAWSGLPDGPGGFATHYRAHGHGWTNRSFVARVSIRRNGAWADGDERSTTVRLFEDDGAEGRLRPTASVVPDPALVRALWQPEPMAPGLDEGARAGHLRLKLSGPEGAFGHAAYAGLLTSALTRAARRRRRTAPALPPPPYTPRLERVWVDYEASAHVVFDEAPADADRGPQKVVHLHPFGTESLYPSDMLAPRPVLPDLGADGQLLLGIACSRSTGPLDLLFELRDDLARDAVAESEDPVAPTWSLLGDAGWIPIPASHVLEDGTQGLRTSGIVTLDLPEGAARHPTRMPGGLLWLRLSTDRLSDGFAGLVAVRAGAVRVRCTDTATAALAALAEGEAPVRWDLAGTAVPGLLGLAAVGRPSGHRPPETVDGRRVRIAERLRHKQRACTPWDYERLVLEAFPSVRKVRCFPNLHSPSGETRPGRVLVVVVPHCPQGDRTLLTRRLKLDAVELRRIRDHLAPLVSGQVALDVRNAAFERVQVRCTLRLRRGTGVGRAVQAVEQAVIDYLSPWREAGPGTHFEWQVRAEDVDAEIRSRVPDVLAVSGTSLLQVSELDDGAFDLGDSARIRAAVAGTASARGRWPWSLALPTTTHLIDVSGDDDADGPPRVTGVDRLAIGETFIVGAPDRPGEAP